MPVNASTIKAAATIRDRQVPVFVKNADVLEPSISAPAMFMPCANTALGEIPLKPDDVCPICSKLSMIAGIQMRPFKSRA
jgi:hypothetical protein